MLDRDTAPRKRPSTRLSGNTLPETNSEFTPENRPFAPKSKFIFQPWIFMGYVTSKEAIGLVEISGRSSLKLKDCCLPGKVR